MERWESATRTCGKIETIRAIQRISELDKEGHLIKDYLKGAIHRENKRKAEITRAQTKKGQKEGRCQAEGHKISNNEN